MAKSPLFENVALSQSALSSKSRTQILNNRSAFSQPFLNAENAGLSMGNGMALDAWQQPTV
jgi:hypothetical protein